jgi:hypothetical protein
MAKPMVQINDAMSQGNHSSPSAVVNSGGVSIYLSYTFRQLSANSRLFNHIPKLIRASKTVSLFGLAKPRFTETPSRVISSLALRNFYIQSCTDYK